MSSLEFLTKPKFPTKKLVMNNGFDTMNLIEECFYLNKYGIRKTV